MQHFPHLGIDLGTKLQKASHWKLLYESNEGVSIPRKPDTRGTPVLYLATARLGPIGSLARDLCAAAGRNAMCLFYGSSFFVNPPVDQLNDFDGYKARYGYRSHKYPVFWTHMRYVERTLQEG